MLRIAVVKVAREHGWEIAGGYIESGPKRLAGGYVLTPTPELPTLS